MKAITRGEIVLKEVVLLTGAGQIGMAIARRIGYGKKLIIGDKNMENADKISKTLIEAGFDVEYVECDISKRESIKNLIDFQMIMDK